MKGKWSQHQRILWLQDAEESKKLARHAPLLLRSLHAWSFLSHQPRFFPLALCFFCSLLRYFCPALSTTRHHLFRRLACWCKVFQEGHPGHCSCSSSATSDLNAFAKSCLTGQKIHLVLRWQPPQVQCGVRLAHLKGCLCGHSLSLKLLPGVF